MLQEGERLQQENMHQEDQVDEKSGTSVNVTDGKGAGIFVNKK